MEDIKGTEANKNNERLIPREDEVTDRECADMLRAAGYEWMFDIRPVKTIAVEHGILRPSPAREMAIIAAKTDNTNGGNEDIEAFERKRGW